MGKRGVLFLFTVVVLLNFLSAGYFIGNASHSFTKAYGPSESLRGWINISLSSESGNSVFEDSEGNSISLLGLLKKRFYIYNCSTVNCSNEYVTTNSQSTKLFQLNKGVSQVLGFKVIGDIKNISSISFSLISDAPSSCQNQVKLDFLSDGVFELGNNKSSAEICDEKSYGCFNQNGATEEYIVGQTFYCQNLDFGEAPGYRVGAWVKKYGAGTGELRMTIFDGSSPLAYCVLPQANVTGGEIYCNINYVVTNPKTYSICLSSDVVNTYKTRGNEAPNKTCGFYGIPPKVPTTAYQIFAQKIKFGGVGALFVSGISFDGKKISGMMQDYVKKKYGSLNCIAGCVIPLKITSGENQLINLNALQLKYVKTSGEVTADDFYDMEEQSPLIDLKFQKVYFDEANFTLPDSYGNFLYSIDFKGEEIIDDNLIIEKIPVITSISPSTVFVGSETTLRVQAQAREGNITEYAWNIDGNIKKTTVNILKFTFTTLGIHNLTISVKDSKGKVASRNFQISTYVSSEQTSDLIDSKKSSIDSLKIKIQTFPVFYQRSIKNKLNLDSAEQSLRTAQEKYALAQEDKDYAEIVSILNSINIPKSASISKEANSIPFFSKRNKINLDIISSVTGESYNSTRESEYLDQIIIWNQNNLNPSVDFTEINSFDGKETSVLLNAFKIELEESENMGEAYIFIEKVEDLEFEKDYGQQENQGYYYIKMPLNEKIVFTTAEDVDFADLPVFMSPTISQLNIGKETPPEKGLSKWVWFVLIIIFLLIGWYIVYALIHEWYRTKYERHLFRDRNNLFNIISYINNSKSNNLANGEIESRLKKSGWNSEQVAYAMKKYEGRRTGMVNLPLLNLFRRKPKRLEPQRPMAPPINPYRTFDHPEAATPKHTMDNKSRHNIENKTNTLAIVAFIFMFVFFPVGLILGIIALSQIKKTGEKGRWMALISIIIPIALMVIGIVLVAILLSST
ncbi:MAG: hypothetical protein AABW50_04560 [Nanoarchaeota archaeon]